MPASLCPELQHGLGATAGRKRQQQQELADGAVAAAEGAPEAVTLAFRSVHCTLTPKKKEAAAGAGDRVLLDNVSGVAKPGRLLAVRPLQHSTQHAPHSTRLK